MTEREAALEAKMDLMLEEVRETRKELKNVAERCPAHHAYLRSQWWHIRSLWAVISAVAGAIVVGSLRKWF